MPKDRKLKFSLDIFRDKRVRYGGYAALVTLAAIVLVVVINLLVQQIPGELDLTKRKLFTLSDQTYDLIDKFDDDVDIFGIYQTGNENQMIVDVMRKYERASRKVNFELIDPDRNPLFIEKYDEEGKGIAPGSLIVESGESFKVIPSIELFDVSYSQQGQPRVMGFKLEQRVTNALLYVTQGVTPKIYELQGHGEFSLVQMGLNTAVEKENFEIESLNLLREPTVPEDADILLVLSPDFDLSDGEADVLLDYLENDGSALLFFELSDAELPNFASVLATFGIELANGIVFEGDRDYLYSAENPLLIVPDLVSHDITTPLSENNLNVLMPFNMPIKSLETRKRNIEIEPLFQTSENSWLRVDRQTRSALRQPGEEMGPFDLGVAIRKRKTLMDEPEGFRLVVAGNASFIGGVYPFGNLKANADFFLNSLAWLNKRSESISIRSKSLFTMPLRISGTMQRVYAGIFVILIPLGILVAGLIVWLRRRHL